MRKYFFFMLAAMSICLTSCGDDDDSDNPNAENERLVGTKWTTTSWDYGVGDDWVTIADETYNIYFHSLTEGFVYHGRKEYDSDFGSSSDRLVAHFTYVVRGNEIECDFINYDDVFKGYGWFRIQGNTLVNTPGEVFTKGTINASDQAWIATLQGTTGMCKWYHNLKNAVWIVGQGDMGNYNSYSDTPWAKCGHGTNYAIVEKGVTSIGSYAFADPSIAGVEILSVADETLRKINPYAFAGSSISEIIANPSSVLTEIGDGAFNGCTYLEDFSIPRNVETIGDYAFNDCKEVSLGFADNLRKVGQFAFHGCKVSHFTDSEVLEEVGNSAFTNLYVDELVLPNSLHSIGHQAFCGNFKEIHVGTGLTNVLGTPFYPYRTGKIYVNLGTPIHLTFSFLDPASGWTLYVPEGCREAYDNAPYWDDFRSIVEDDTLIPGNGTPGVGDGDDEEDGDEGNVNVTIPQTYTNGGQVYKWVKVESPTLPTFYIMQTELDSHSHLRIGDAEIGILDSNDDNAVIKAEFRKFLETIEEKTGLIMRLPTREEWRYAASGGNKSRGYTYSGSDDIDEVAWYKGNSDLYAHPLAEKKPNELGLYDMSGNYYDLCNDDPNDRPNVDGSLCGGCWKDAASACTVNSYKASPASPSDRVPGTNMKEYNAFDARNIAVRLIFTAP